MRSRGCCWRSGFTLVELLVVVLIMGILTVMMMPRYTKTVENTKADDAAGVVTMIGQANRMCNLDNNTYASGTLSDGTCGAGAACNCQLGSCSVCQLLNCHYLGVRPWGTAGNPLSYTYSAGASCPAPPSGGTAVACARRSSLGSPQFPYTTWAYVMNNQGKIDTLGTPVMSPTGNIIQPKPVQ